MKILSYSILVIGLISTLIVEPSIADTVGYWRFEDGTASDSSAYNNHGTIWGDAEIESNFPIGTIPLTGQPNTKSLTLDGTDDAVVVADHISLLPTNAITIEAWVYLNSDQNAGGIIAGRQFGTTRSNSYQFATPRREVFFGLTDSTGTNYNLYTGYTLDTLQWYHLAATWDGSYMRAYIDGNEVETSVSFTGVLGDTHSNPIIIGADDDNYGAPGTPGCCFFDGYLDEVRISNTALSQNQFLNVVPEPISSILFVTGGTLLAGRRYMKRKKKA